MDVVFDLVNVQGCIFLKRLRIRAMAMGLTLHDVETCLDEWQALGIIAIEHGVVIMLIVFAP